MSARTVLLLGDKFVRCALLEEALREEVGQVSATSVELAWPIVPFGRVAEVDEASGSEEDVLAHIQGKEIIVTEMAPLTARVFAAADALRLVVVTRGGPVNVNLEAATRHGVVVCNIPGRNAQAAAEYALGMILAAVRRIAEAHSGLVGGRWRGDLYAYEEAGFELGGSTVGLVGFGAIGRIVARALTALGAQVLVYDPYVRDEEVRAVGAARTSLEELLRSCRVVSLHARLTPETTGLIGRRELQLMPRGSALVNTARGGLLDYSALVEALSSGHLWAAALDVFPEEPLPPDSPLLAMPRVVVSPHIAGSTRETAERAARLAAAQVARYLRGEPLQHVLNPEVMEQGHADRR